MAGLPQGASLVNTDSFHDVWETEPEVHLPEVLNNCTTPQGCTLQTITITQAVYHNGQDLEIWKKHFDVPWLDTGMFPISAVEMRTKMSSREHIYTNLGIPNPSFEELDGGGVRCGEINQASLDWAMQRVGQHTKERFAQVGQPYGIMSDKNVCPAGPCWIWDELSYIETDDGKQVLLESPQFSTAMNYPLPMTGFQL